MRIRGAYLVAVPVLVLVSGGAIVNHAQQPAKVDFVTEIQPIFRQHCITCHGPREQKNGLRLDRRRDAMRGGTIAVIGPGNSAGSRLYHRLIGSDFGPQMPPTGALRPEQIAKIKAWIDQGAEWPDAASGEKPPTPADPEAVPLIAAIRERNASRAGAILSGSPDVAGKRAAGGATPLMYAALYGDAAMVRQLLERGADVNASDDAGATALMWAVTDLEKTRLLVERGADVNARSAEGRTALLIASAIPGGAPVVRLLLDKGADIKSRGPSLFGETTPLIQAAYAADEATFMLLVERGADLQAAGAAAVALAGRSGCQPCIAVLMKALGNAVATDVLMMSSPPSGPALPTAALVAAGADVDAKDPAGHTALMLAAASEAGPVDGIKALIDKGADVNARTAAGYTALSFARAHGDTPAAQFLVKAGAIDGRGPVRVPANFARAGSPRAALRRTLPLVQRADEQFLKKAACVSCHNNSVAAMTVSLARARGLRVDEAIAKRQLAATGSYAQSWKDRALQGIGIPGDSTTVGYVLMGLAAEGYAADETTDALARFLLHQQRPDGSWLPLAHRPPIEGDPVQATAISMMAIEAFAPSAARAVYRAAVERAGEWLKKQTPRTNEGRAFQLLGLQCAGAGRGVLDTFARTLLAQQRADGGWAQLATLPSDAYATGQALVALAKTESIPVSHPAFARGVQFLLRTQFADGSWHVRSRAIPLQPHFEAGFPYGKDQFISAAATNWAAMALAFAAGGGS